mmetsp:Transcript_18263/g.8497  ORF Transcript_18263/g.8497 Transcript_18263/m.8497 type:complete len:84 (-) Transcript_18263:117-368(-)
MYMAPELFSPVPKITTAADIWSFACIITEIFSGQRPFAGENEQSIRNKLNRGEYPNIPLMPPALYKLCELCFQKDYRNRPTID